MDLGFLNFLGGALGGYNQGRQQRFANDQAMAAQVLAQQQADQLDQYRRMALFAQQPPEPQPRPVPFQAPSQQPTAFSPQDSSRMGYPFVVQPTGLADPWRLNTRPHDPLARYAVSRFGSVPMKLF